MSRGATGGVLLMWWDQRVVEKVEEFGGNMQLLILSGML